MRSGHYRNTAAAVGIVVGIVVAAGCGDDGGNNTADGGDGGDMVTCGDGVMQGIEECDDGTANSDTASNACRTTCELPGCGDGVVDDNEECDEGPQNSDGVPDACRSDCSAPGCGDNVVDVISGETCDDGNDMADDGCSPTCLVEYCGNGVLDPGEVCDDGNILSGDGCSASCTSVETCGNSFPDFATGEQCDDGNHRSHDGCSSGCTGEFPVWTPWTEALGTIADHSMAYDSGRGALVIFGGAGTCGPICRTTYEHDGARWQVVQTPTQPPSRSRAAMAYDSQRGVMVLFGGRQAGYLADTWEYDGTDWTQVTTANHPSGRARAAMTYDANRQVTVLFGGEDNNGFNNETWEYDGTDWQLVGATGSPTPRVGAAAVYDSQRQLVVLLGGEVSSSSDTATYEYDGTAWTQVLTTTNTWTRSHSAMTYDASRMVTVMFSGFSSTVVCGSSLCADIWEYNGVDWTQRTSGGGPEARRGHAMAYDPGLGKVVLVGGATMANAALDDTWTWDGNQWMNLTAAVRPQPRNRHAMVYEASEHRLVMFGGDEGGAEQVLTPDTWLFDLQGWRRLPCPGVNQCPEARSGHAMVYDSQSDESVLFGGQSDGGSTYVVFDDTWVFAGDTWTQVTTSVTPTARAMFAMAYDPVRDRTVVFGGQEGNDVGAEVYDDTWEFDGTDWVLVNTAHSPPARGVHAMAWDAANQEIVMFGGVDEVFNTFTDTWTYDGTDWTEKNPTQAPPPRGWPVLVHDPLRNRMVLYGGLVLDGYLDDSWEWDGSDWKQVFANPPSGRGFSAAAYYPELSSVAVHGGFAGVALGDTYFFRYDSQWPEEVCDSGLDADNDGDTDCADPDCEGQPCATNMICAGGACIAAP